MSHDGILIQNKVPKSLKLSQLCLHSTYALPQIDMFKIRDKGRGLGMVLIIGVISGLGVLGNHKPHQLKTTKWPNLKPTMWMDKCRKMSAKLVSQYFEKGNVKAVTESFRCMYVFEVQKNV